MKVIESPSFASPPVTEKLGASSLSVIVTSVPVTVREPEDPVTSMVSSGSSRLSSTGVTVKVPLRLAAPAAMVRVTSDTAA